MGVACVGEGEGGVSFCAIVGGGRKVVIVTMATLLHCIQWLLEQQLLNQVTKVTVSGCAGSDVMSYFAAGVGKHGRDRFSPLSPSLPPH